MEKESEEERKVATAREEERIRSVSEDLRRQRARKFENWLSQPHPEAPFRAFGLKSFLEEGDAAPEEERQLIAVGEEADQYQVPEGMMVLTESYAAEVGEVPSFPEQDKKFAREEKRRQRDLYLVDGYKVSCYLGVVPFHDLWIQDTPQYQRLFPNLCLRLKSFLSSRANYFQGGGDIFSELVNTLLPQEDLSLYGENRSLQSAPRFVQSQLDKSLFLTYSEKRGLCVDTRGKGKNQQWVFTHSFFLENLETGLLLSLESSDSHVPVMRPPAKSSTPWKFKNDCIVCLASQTHRVLDVDQGVKQRGQSVILWEKKNMFKNRNQKWTLIEVANNAL